MVQRGGLLRTNAGIAAGTALSRITGYGRVLALAYLMQTSSGTGGKGSQLSRGLPPREHDPEHHLRPDPRRHPLGDARPVVHPGLRGQRRRRGERDRDDRGRGVAGGHRGRDARGAAHHQVLYGGAPRSRCRRRPISQREHDARVLLPAADLLLRDDRHRDRVAERPPPFLRRRVGARAQQRRRDRACCCSLARSSTRCRASSSCSRRPRSVGCWVSAPPRASSQWRWCCCRRSPSAGVHIKPRLDWRHPAIKKLVRLSGWTAGYVVANQIAFLIVTQLAQRSAGGFTAYSTMYTFFQLPYGLLAVTVMTTVSPELARDMTHRDRDAFRRRIRDGLWLIILLMVPGVDRDGRLRRRRSRSSPVRSATSTSHPACSPRSRAASSGSRRTSISCGASTPCTTRRRRS